jgi:hypothetical protein
MKAMVRFSSHLSDEAMLSIIDGELPARRQTRAERHLSSCAACRARRVQVERMLVDVSACHSLEAHRPLPSAASARARLATRLAHESARSSEWFGPFAVPVSGHQLLSGAFVLFVVVAGAVMLPRPSRSPLATDANGLFLLPRPELTPGAAAPVALRDICEPDRQSRTQPVRAAVHQAVFAGYGADYRRATDYELDYLITPELGGVADARNLWPQPFARTPWNAYVKDELERFFHQQVCIGTLDLAAVQREMASDWIAAYKRHFKTSTPRRDYAAAPLNPFDRDLILSELEELGVSPRNVQHGDGRTLMAMLQTARGQPPAASPRLDAPFAIIRGVH